MTHTINTDHAVAVAVEYFWQPIDSCPHSVKVQLLSRYGVAVYGTYHGKDDYWVGWAPLPRVPKEMK